MKTLHPAFSITRLGLLAFAALSSAVLYSACRFHTRQSQRDPGQAVILAVNDTYLVEGMDGGKRGGLSWVKSLRDQLDKSYGKTLVLHAGDLLSPSELSRSYHGAQMVDMLNHLHDSPPAFDDELFVTFGNHEFDRTKLGNYAEFKANIAAAQFSWLGSNIEFLDSPSDPAPHVLQTALKTLGGIRVGIYGLTTDMVRPEYVVRFRDPIETSRQVCADLRKQGAEVVIAVTHQDMEMDRRLVDTLQEQGPDIVIGGHEHTAAQVRAAGRWILKADSDAQSATVLNIRRGSDGKITFDPKLVPFAADSVFCGQTPDRCWKPQLQPDPSLAQRAREWNDRYAREFCAANHQDASCLDRVIGRTAVALTGEELRIRMYETNLGNYLTDLMKDAFATQGAQVAFLNSGTIRLNKNIPAGSTLHSRELDEMFGFPAPLRLIKINGRILRDVLRRSTSIWQGNGWWLQVSGLAFRFDPDRNSVEDVTLLTPSGPRKVTDDEQILAVTSAFLLDPSGNQDGYRVLNQQMILAEGQDLHDLVEARLAGAGEAGISPRVEGRICNTREPGPCLAVAH